MIAKKVHRLDFVEGSIYIYTYFCTACHLFQKNMPSLYMGALSKREPRILQYLFFCTIWAIIVQLVMFSRFVKKRKENYKASFFLIRF